MAGKREKPGDIMLKLRQVEISGVPIQMVIAIGRSQMQEPSIWVLMTAEGV